MRTRKVNDSMTRTGHHLVPPKARLGECMADPHRRPVSLPAARPRRRRSQSSWPARQYLTSPAARLLRNAPGCAPNSATIVIEQIARYNPEAAVCVGIPFGHMRPQWIIPHGGTIMVDGTARRVVADYS
jgi:hypothetical protein